MYHIGLEVLYVIGLSVRKKMFYLEAQFSTLLLKNQEILMFKSGSVIIMDLWKMHFEARTLVIIWMGMTPSLMMTKRVLLKGDKNEPSMRRNISPLTGLTTLRFE